MSFGEREALTSLVTMLLVLMLFYWYLGNNFAAGVYDAPDGLMVWARSVLKLILAGMGVALIVTVLSTAIVAFLHKMGTADEPAPDLTDERDHLIEVRGMRIGSHVMTIGLVAMILDLAFNGGTVFRALNLVLLASAMSEVTKNIYKIYRYRAGF